jgi:hypothetical protein
MDENDPMTDLSAAAQAVEDAYFNADGFGYRNGLAAALRAAAEKLGYMIYDYENNEHRDVVKVERLLAIAAELEGFN